VKKDPREEREYQDGCIRRDFLAISSILPFGAVLVRLCAGAGAGVLVGASALFARAVLLAELDSFFFLHKKEKQYVAAATAVVKFRPHK
jgi:hypothetical protein